MSKFYLLNVTLKVRLISNFFQMIITTAFLPFIALYLTDMVNAKFSGTFLTILVLLNIPIGLFGGHIIDVFSKRKTILNYQLFMTIALLVMTFALIENVDNLVLFCVGYIVFSIIWGLQFPAMDAIIMDAITPDVENIVYKIDYWLGNTSTALGMFLGGYLYHSNKSIILFVATVVFFFVFLALLKWIPKRNVINASKEKYALKNIFQNYSKVFKDKKYMMLVISFSLLVSAEFSTSSYVALRLKNEFNPVSLFNININGVQMFSFVMIVNTVVVVFMSYIVMKGFNIFKEKTYFLLGLILYIIGYVNITHLNSFYPLIIAMIIAAIGEIIYSPVIQEKKYKMTPENSRGSYSAIGNLGFSASELIARLGILLGTFFTAFGMSVYMLIILLLGSIGIYLSIFNRGSETK
ncbi:TPA: MFS transporter [Staphylococcus delphini]|nr:MFS transporter [Staphylococcus delphini]